MVFCMLRMVFLISSMPPSNLCFSSSSKMASRLHFSLSLLSLSCRSTRVLLAVSRASIFSGSCVVVCLRWCWRVWLIFPGAPSCPLGRWRVRRWWIWWIFLRGGRGTDGGFDLFFVGQFLADVLEFLLGFRLLLGSQHSNQIINTYYQGSKMSLSPPTRQTQNKDSCEFKFKYF